MGGFDRGKFAGSSHGGFKQLHENYKITKKLGEGSFGTVQLATSMATNDNRAIKNILKRKLPDVKRFAAEIEIHRSLDHPNVVKLYEIYEDARCMYRHGVLHGRRALRPNRQCWVLLGVPGRAAAEADAAGRGLPPRHGHLPPRPQA